MFVRKSPSRGPPTYLRFGPRRSPSTIAATPLPTAFGGGLREAPGYAALPIRNIFVEQTGQTPWVAGRPFFIVMAWELLISLLVRHFTQYASKGCLQIQSTMGLSYYMSSAKSAVAPESVRRQPSYTHTRVSKGHNIADCQQLEYC